MEILRTTLWDNISKYNGKVILLEGSRDITVIDYKKLVVVGRSLALVLPGSIFRSGNAPGSDEAFIKGVGMVEGSHIELILPFADHRKQNIPPSNSRNISLEDLSAEELNEIKRIGSKANPDRSSLLNHYQPEAKSIPNIKASYLLRDVLKVTGSLSNGFLPCSVGIFYLNPKKPQKGGTAFTIAVAKYMGIETYTHDEYIE